MATDGITAAFLKMFAKAKPADQAGMLADLHMGKAFDIVEAGAESLSNSEFVPDQFAMGHVDTVPTEAEIKTGPTEAATGANAERQIDHYSPNKVAQHGLVAAAEQLGRLVGPRMAAMEKSMERQHQAILLLSTALQGMMKSAVEAPLAKSEDTEKEERKKEVKKDEKGEDEKAKSLLVERASAEFATAKSLIKTAEELEGDGRAGTAKSRREEAQAAFAKAENLLGAATTLGATGDAFTTLAAALPVFAKAKEINTNQARYPDSTHKDGTVVKAETKDEDDAMSKAVKAMNDKMAEVSKAVEGIGMLKTTVEGLMQTVSGQSRGVGRPDMSALVKSDPQAFLKLKAQEVAKAQDEGRLTDDEIMAAQDIIGKMQASQIGLIQPHVVQTRIAQSSTAVRNLFAEAA